jgi:hypothetical protein
MRSSAPPHDAQGVAGHYYSSRALPQDHSICKEIAYARVNCKTFIPRALALEICRVYSTVSLSVKVRCLTCT